MARLERASGANLWISMILTEGKNREVRRVLAHLGLKVNRLIRVGYGPFTLGSLGRGGVAEVPDKRLRDALEGPKTPKTGWAKAKPRPAKPGRAARAKAAGGKVGGKAGGGKTGGGKTGAAKSKRKAGRADRRRPL